MGTNFTRRTVLAGAGATVAALLTACFSNDGKAPSTTGAATTSAAPTDAPVPSITITDAMLATFEADIEAAMQAFGMLGAAVAIVAADKIIFNRGYGIRDSETGAGVTPNTRFRIGSNTKSMTSLLIAKYVDQGLCAWDTPVIDLWPGFVGPTRP